jgi:hypothetical protein
MWSTSAAAEQGSNEELLRITQPHVVSIAAFAMSAWLLRPMKHSLRIDGYQAGILQLSMEIRSVISTVRRQPEYESTRPLVSSCGGESPKYSLAVKSADDAGL